jgi:hypothetical protein
LYEAFHATNQSGPPECKHIHLLISLLTAGCSDEKVVEPKPQLGPKLTLEVFDAGLTSPQGLMLDAQERRHVAEQGTGNADAYSRR